jgi:hypothetical protein
MLLVPNSYPISVGEHRRTKRRRTPVAVGAGSFLHLHCPELKLGTTGARLPFSECPEDKAEIKKQIAERISSNQSLTNISQMPGWPSRNTVWLWRKADPQFEYDMGEANRCRAEYLCDLLQEIAEDDSKDVDAQGKPNFVPVQRDKLKVDTIKALAAMLDRQRFGDQTTTKVIGDPNRPVAFTQIDPEARSRRS